MGAAKGKLAADDDEEEEDTVTAASDDDDDDDDVDDGAGAAEAEAVGNVRLAGLDGTGQCTPLRRTI